MLLANINEVIKASPAIQIQNRITHLQRRAWNLLLANAYHELADKDIHRVSVADLAAKLGFDSKNDEYLKVMIKSLVDCTVEWNILGKNNKQVWGAASLLGSVEIENGICTYNFPAHLRMKLYNPIMYTKLNLRLQNQFKSQYALILWEVCFDYFSVERGRGETPFIPLETFRELMGVESDEYPLFGEFNRNVIKSAVKEINALTDYFVEVEQKRFARKVAELKFRIARVKKFPVQESVLPDVEDLPPVAMELVQANVDRAVALEIATAEWEFILPEKLPTPGDYTDFLAYVSEKIEMAMYASNVNNTGGYVVEAIRNNYQNDEVRKAREVRAERAREKDLEDLDEAFRARRANLLRQAIQADPGLVERAGARIENNFVRTRVEACDTAMEGYQAYPVVKACIDDIIATEFCKDLFAPVNAAYEDEKARILGESD